MTALALLLVAAVNFLPEVLPGSMTAWEYVMHGIEAAFLWLLVLLASRTFLLQLVATFAMLEAGERAVCRLMFSMDNKPPLSAGQTLCDAATGFPMSLVSAGLALYVALIINALRRML